MLAKQHDCPIVLGSATPSLESWQNVQLGKYHLHRLSQRVGGGVLPKVTLVSLKKQTNPEIEKGAFQAEEAYDIPYWCRPVLFEKMQAHLSRRQQVALFLNRRGEFSTTLCEDCGEAIQCPFCSVTLTRHARVHLVCHYCHHMESYPQRCPQCGQGAIKSIGLGTERIQRDLQGLFPHKTIRRMDRDEIAHRKQLEEIIAEVASGEVDILVGTQMITKGLDFPRLTLVGVVLADMSLHMPDFRATERTFQLISQMAGRAGRHLPDGEVVIQTYSPQNIAIQFALKNDFESFAQEEMRFRSELGYPPFGRTALIWVEGPGEALVTRTSDRIAQQLRQWIRQYSQFKMLGPVTAPLFKIKNKYRMQILLKGPPSTDLPQFCRHISQNLPPVSPIVRVSIDVDPFSML